MTKPAASSETARRAPPERVGTAARTPWEAASAGATPSPGRLGPEGGRPLSILLLLLLSLKLGGVEKDDDGEEEEEEEEEGEEEEKEFDDGGGGDENSGDGAGDDEARNSAWRSGGGRDGE